MTDCRTCLSMDREKAREAAKLWTSLAPDSSLDAVIELDGPNDPVVIDLTIAGTRYQILGAPHMNEPTMASSFFLTVADQAQLDRFWDGILAAGGEELECSWIKDPFGFFWQVVPEVLTEAMFGDDTAVRQAAVEVVWTQRRVDVAAVEKAVEAARG
ncbi:VOC family protein [Brachybacterium huguangmaarense]